MRAYLALLGLALAACSSNDGSTTTPAERLDNLGKPATTPLGSLADKNAPSAASVAPAPATAQAPAAAPAGWPTPFQAASTNCSRKVVRAATILTRPVAGANKFGQLTVGDQLMLLARTADGWVGFDPGSAQAGNVGIFRLRWVRANEAFAPGDSCPQQLPLVQAPPLGCLLMAARATPVHPHPAPGTARLGTIPAGSYAQVVKASVGPDKWAEVLVPGSKAHGFIAQSDINFSGDCN